LQLRKAKKEIAMLSDKNCCLPSEHQMIEQKTNKKSYLPKFSFNFFGDKK
jgi:hypothetical protein